ncbi:MAG: hypothetical protein Q7N50_15710 [Armatimonadota bacterium]|nr:hypothetical protein [Armatimonadota bacterium]
MSWLSKWWRGGGREVVRDGLLQAADERLKKEIVKKLRLLLATLDKLDISGVRGKLTEIIEYVEAQ